LGQEESTRCQQVMEEENKRLQSLVEMWCRDDHEEVQQLQKDIVLLKEQNEELEEINKEMSRIIKEAMRQFDSEKRRLSLKLQQYIRQDCPQWPSFLQCSTSSKVHDISEQDVHLPSFLISL
jgi:exonuclease VII large subunit